MLANLVATTPRDVIDHMGALGVDVPPIPLIGSTCPMCGRRMPVSGHALDNGICDACNARLSLEADAMRDAERRAYNDLKRHRIADSRGGR